jgi:hypothetical protein
MREHELAVAWGLDFLRLASAQTFTFTDQASRYSAWLMLAGHDPTLTGAVDKYGKAIEAHGPDQYGRSAVVMRDTVTGRRYVRSGWFQEYVRRTGSNVTPHEVAGLMLQVGWERANRQGRIKATDPTTKATINTPFYIVPPDWEDAQEADE